MAKFQLVITHDQESGTIQVQGPTDNPMLCYGMLDFARLQIHEAHMQHQRQRQLTVAPADAQLPPPPGSNGHGPRRLQFPGGG